MKRLLTYILLFFATAAMAEITSDKVVATVDGNLMPGGEQVVLTVSLQGKGHYYCGYQMDLVLPEGLEPDVENMAMCEDGEEGLYPYKYNALAKKYTYTHHVSATYGIAGERTIRISCISDYNEAFTKTAGDLFRMFFKAGTYAKPGEAKIKVSDASFITYDKSSNVTTPYRLTQEYLPGVMVGTDAKAALTVSSANKWATCILPFAADVPEGMKVYVCNSKDDAQKVFNLTAVTAFEAYRPYVLYCEKGYDGTLEGTVEADRYPETGMVREGLLTGAVTRQHTSEGYILQQKAGMTKFYKTQPDKVYTIPAGKCWANPVETAESYGMRITMPTAIEEIKGNATMGMRKYTLDGKAITTPLPGQPYKVKK